MSKAEARVIATEQKATKASKLEKVAKAVVAKAKREIKSLKATIRYVEAEVEDTKD